MASNSASAFSSLSRASFGFAFPARQRRNRRTAVRMIAAELRLMPHFHLSLQAGDDMILKRMKRRHLRTTQSGQSSDQVGASDATSARPRCGFSDRNRRNGINSKTARRLRHHRGPCFSLSPRPIRRRLGCPVAARAGESQAARLREAAARAVKIGSALSSAQRSRCSSETARSHRPFRTGDDRCAKRRERKAHITAAAAIIHGRIHGHLRMSWLTASGWIQKTAERVADT